MVDIMTCGTCNTKWTFDQIDTDGLCPKCGVLLLHVSHYQHEKIVRRITPTLKRMLKKDRAVAAIKYYRSLTGYSMHDGKRLMDGFLKEMRLKSMEDRLTELEK